jgi:kynurenine formamidase/2-keto-3-deoxy-L-rhamnonate aldolase RhmA
MFEQNGPSLRTRLRRDGPLGVFWFAIGSPALVEISGGAKPDAVVIDAQHGLWDRQTLEHAVGIIGHQTPVLVRTADSTPTAVSQALDSGAEGVIVPLIETDVEAAQAVAAARFPPQGSRSGGGVRPLMHDFPAYCASANERTVVGVMIETQRGVRNAAAIAATPGIDFVLIGTGDLALSIGCFPQVDGRHEEACRTVLESCRTAQVPCGIFTGNAEAAIKRGREGYDLVVVANDLEVVSRGFSTAMNQFNGKATTARAGYSIGAGRSSTMASRTLLDFAAAIADGRIRVVDLTQTLRPSTPVIQLPPQFAPSNPFRILEISKYDDRGPAWYWNNFSCGEHTGTHFDAPIHWVTGKDYQDGYTDTVPVQRMIAPAVVIDCSKEVAENELFLLEPSHIEAWEKQHGRIPAGAWVLMRTDWSKREEPASFLNMKEDGPHVPGPSAAAIKFLVEERDVNGWGVEAVGTDAGQGFAFEPAFPAHHLMHGANKFGLASLCNLDQLPPTGALLVTPPLKIEKGSGSPLRVLALVAG